jgi:hypothetical protein
VTKPEEPASADNPEPLDKSEGLLYHQVHPTFTKDGVPSMRGFQPNTNDGGQLSIDRSTLSTPQEAYDRYTALGKQSAGTWGFETKVVINAGASAYQQELPDNPAHGYVDFKEMDLRALAAILRHDAVVRGCLHTP